MIGAFQNHRILLTAIGLVAVAGLSSLTVIVRQEDPTITNGVAVIISPYPGASAERVEALVTDKLEDELKEISEIQTVSSTSRDGISVVSVEIDETILGDDTQPVFSKIRDAVDDAYTLYPPGLPEPIFDDERFGAYTLILGLRWDSSQPVELGILRRYAQELQDRLRDLSGSDSVKLWGAPKEEIDVRFDAELLASSGLTPASVARALRQGDAKVASGVVRNSKRNVLIELEGELDSLDRVRNVPVNVGPEGQILRVGDLARVERSIQDPPSDLAVVDGAPAVVVAAQMGEGVRFDVWSAKAWKVVDEFKKMLPDGIVLDTVFDQTVYTRARLDELLGNLMTGLLLVVGILFLTMGWRAAVIVALTLPLVSMASVTILLLMDVPIHQMSVTGLIVALGLLVDNAIVVTDQIRMRRASGMPSAQAVKTTIDRLWLPLLSSTATTVLGFMPILLLPGRVGEFVGTIALSVIIALISSFVFAMTITSAVAGKFIPATERTSNILTRGVQFPALGRAFDRSLAWSLRRPKTSMALASVLPLVGFVGAASLPKQFFPPADRNQINIELRVARQVSIDRTLELAKKADDVLREYGEVEAVSWFVGRSAPPFYYNLRQSQDGNSSYAQAQVTVTSTPEAKRLMPILQEQLDMAFPEGQFLVRELLQGPPVDAPIEFRIYGDDIEVLRSVGEELRERMSRVPAVTHSLATLTASSPKLRFDADEDKAAVAGLSLVGLASQLQTQLDGIPSGSILEGTEEIDVRLRADSATRSSFNGVQGLNFTTGLADQGFSGIPMTSLGEMTLEPVLDGIPRRDGKRVNTVRGYTEASVFPEKALSALRAILEEDPVDVPAGYTLEVGGDAAERGEALANLFASIPVLTLLMFACVAISLNSFRLAVVIFVVGGQAMGLGFLSLAALGYPLGFQALIGSIGLIGVAINAAIIINAALQARPRSVSGDVEDIKTTVIGETSRHIISTTITTFVGFLPLILAPGGFWPPFATAIAGGVLLSGLISFFFVPQCFLLLTRRKPLADDASETGGEKRVEAYA